MLRTESKPAQVEKEPGLRPDGPAGAVVVSATIGVFLLGLATTLASAIPAVKSALDWWSPTGPLAGKAGVAVIGWVASWILLHRLWMKRDVSFRRIWAASILLFGLGMILMFPPVFEALE